MRQAPVIVIGCVIGLTLSFAPLFNLGVFIKPLAFELGWSRTQITSGAAMATLGVAIAAPFIGRLIDRLGPRRVIVISSAAFAVSLALVSTLPRSYPLFLLLCGLVGLTGAGTTPLTYLAVVARWFDRKLGLALGVAMVGLGAGMALSPIIGEALLRTAGLKHAFLGLAALAALAIPNAILLLRDPPTAKAPTYGETPASGPDGQASRTIFTSWTFWGLAVAMFLMTVVVAGSGVHLIALMTDRGYSPVAAAKVAAMLGLALLGGRLVTGYLLDHVRVAVLGAATFLIGVVGVVVLALGGGGVAPIVAALFIGFAQGAEGDIMAFAVRKSFPTEAYGKTYGWLFAVFNLGALSGPLLMAAAYDSLGSYDRGLWFLAGLGLIATAFMASVRTAQSARV